MSSLKPVVEDISSWDSCKEILYKCPKCNTSFRILGHYEKFCHNCGQKINWDDVPRYLADPYREDDYKERKLFLSVLNSWIQR